MPTTPPRPNTPTSTHLPPSLPNSPLAKRPKTMAAIPKSPLPSSIPLPQTPASTTDAALPPGPNSVSLSEPPLLIKKLSTDATTPTRGSAFAAGYDLYSARATKIPARGKGFAETDLAIAVPAGTCKFSNMLLVSRVAFFPYTFSWSGGFVFGAKPILELE